MSPFLQLAFELVVILLAAKAAGVISTRLGQPSVLGELLIGVLLGPIRKKYVEQQIANLP